MTGVIEKCNKNRAEFFFIRGDDGNRYFGHRHQVVNMKHYTQFCYEGNRVRFVPGEFPQKEGDNQEANCIEFETVDKYDMMAKKIREQESEIEKLMQEQEAVEPKTIPEELKLKMWNAFYAEEDEYEKKFVGKEEHLNWFTVYRPWLQKGFDIAINVIADWEGR